MKDKARNFVLSSLKWRKFNTWVCLHFNMELIVRCSTSINMIKRHCNKSHVHCEIFSISLNLLMIYWFLRNSFNREGEIRRHDWVESWKVQFSFKSFSRNLPMLTNPWLLNHFLLSHDVIWVEETVPSQRLSSSTQFSSDFPASVKLINDKQFNHRRQQIFDQSFNHN